MRPRPVSLPRGSTLIEAMVASTILLVALAGLLPLQVMGARMNRWSERTLEASSLANDLTESIERWSYSDARLTPLTTVTSLNDPAISATWDMGTSATASHRAQYSDSPNPDPNASTSNALGTNYQGFSSDMDGDGKPDFTRYWNVYTVDSGSAGSPSGKLVQVIVRWNEPKVGWHQIVVSTFKRNPGALF
jgi:Tfp pilus assembly protein PilV